MESITVKIKYKEYKASLELNNKITVVVGLSATGKSTIHKVLDVKDNRKAISISNKQYELRI